MFRYPLSLDSVSPWNLWILDPSGARVAAAERARSGLGGSGPIRVGSLGETGPAAELLRVEADAPTAETPGGERLAAEALKRRYDMPGVPGAAERPLDHVVLGPEGLPLGRLGVRSNVEGVVEVADARGETAGWVRRVGMFSRDCDVEVPGRGVVMRLRRRGLLFGRMELSGPEDLTEDEEALLLAGVVFVLLRASSGGG